METAVFSNGSETLVLGVGLVEHDTVDDDLTVLQVDRLAAGRDDALDQRAVGDKRIGERDDVPFLGLARVIGKLLREDEVAHFDGVLHRTRGNLIGAKHEGVQQAREAEHDEYHDDDAQQAAGHLRALAFGMLTGKHEARYPFDTGGGTTRDSSREFE